MDSAKQVFWWLFAVLMLVLVVGIAFYAIPAVRQLGNGFYPAHTMTVSAEGKTTAAPDMAELSFSVVSQGQDPAALTKDNTDKMNAVLKFVKSQNIADEDIKTTNYNLSPNYQWDKFTQKNFINGYTLTQTVEVKVRDLTKVASVIGGLTPLGINQIGNIGFTFADDEKVLQAARADAFSKATTKAQEMAKAAGVSLGRIVNVAENNYIPGPRPFYLDAKMALGMGGAVASAPEIQPGTQDITDTVNITYEIN